MHEFFKTNNTEKFDDLDAFKEFYSRELLPKTALYKEQGESYRVFFKGQLRQLKKQAIEKSALKILVAIDKIEKSLQPGIDLVKLTEVFDTIQDSFDDMMDDKLGYLKEIYPVFDNAYKDDINPMISSLKKMAIENNGLALVYLLESLRESYEAGVIYDLGKSAETVQAEFADQENFETVNNTLKKAYESAGEDVQNMRMNLLLRILRAMEQGDEEITSEELLQLGRNADSVILEAEWDIAETEGYNAKIIEMQYILKMAILQGLSNGFHALTEYETFHKIIESDYESYIGFMIASDSYAMRLAALPYLRDEVSEVFEENILQAVNDLDLKNLASEMLFAIQSRNSFAMDLLLESDLLQIEGEDVPQDVVLMLSDLLKVAFTADAPEIVYTILNTRLLSKKDVVDIGLDFDQEKANMFSSLPKMLSIIMDHGDEELFDLLMALVGEEKINMTINEDGNLLQYALLNGHSAFADHIIDVYLTSSDLQNEALECLNSRGENALHRLSPDIDSSTLDKVMKLNGVEKALEVKVDFDSAVKGLTPILSIVNIYDINAAGIMQAYVDAGANIYAFDQKGMDLSGWVENKLHQESGEPHPIIVLLNKKFEEPWEENSEVFDGVAFDTDSRRSSESELSSSDSAMGSPTFESAFGFGDMVPKSFVQMVAHCGNEVHVIGNSGFDSLTSVYS